MEFIKKAACDPQADDLEVRDRVAGMLEEIERNGEDAVRRYARDLDGWTGDFVLSDDKRRDLIASVPETVKD
ncbi:MAG: histidinol dehydrogenase, partial [Alphaproteobacteria bacterium]